MGNLDINGGRQRSNNVTGGLKHPYHDAGHNDRKPQARTNRNPVALKTGARLYRSWQGVTQEVLVLDGGYGWRGKSYANLSEVARAITGEVLDDAGVSFVSVTQQFNTTTSMGRLTLNVLLSFAQFEREVTAERIRDKIAQSKVKGIWMGGTVPIGYDLGARELLVNPKEAAQVRQNLRAIPGEGIGSDSQGRAGSPGHEEQDSPL